MDVTVVIITAAGSPTVAGSPPTSATGSPQSYIVQLLATSIMVCTFMDYV